MREELKIWGWNPYFSEAFQAYDQTKAVPARVTAQHKEAYRVISEWGEVMCEVSGKLRFEALSRQDYPAVGDWVVLKAAPGEKKGIIHGVLPRFSKCSRKAAGNVPDEQIVAANVNVLFLLNALNEDYNLRRLERYLVIAWESGASPVIVLSKADLCPDVDRVKGDVGRIAPGVPVHAVSAETGEGISELREYLNQGITAALLGSSGAGKSTLTNVLIGSEVARTGDIRQADGRGRHTTTYRELLLVPEGGLLIDTPGMREVQLWEAEEGLGTSFGDIENLAKECRFPDCRHGQEPGCAVRQALDDGRLEEARLYSFKKMERELAHLARKEQRMARTANRARERKSSRMKRHPVSQNMEEEY